ncbi:MAG TPA: hypothetical protein VHT34_01410 [Clostridia bacterium]|nr:hypothetical protein [Clostridia bacterium]
MRSNFPKLLLENPNYFGNLKDSKFKPVVAIASNKNYEEISQLGYNPVHKMLYAIVTTKQNSGYSGSLCNNGSYEYVRFYVDWNNDGDFKDACEDYGMGSVNVHDIPGNKPLNYCISVKLNPKGKSCKVPYLVKVRAILSWNSIPPANSPEYTPVWGEVQECMIQIKPAEILLSDFVDSKDIKIDKSVINNINVDLPIQKEKIYSVEELKELYKGLNVEEHRLNIKEISLNLNNLPKSSGLALGEFSPSIKEGMLSSIKAPANVSYEELKAVGLQYDNDTLTAIIKLNKPCGFSGGLCSKGSTEYVAFFADWNNNGDFESYLGTAAVNVHDIASIPKEGLYYAASLPLNLADKKKLCKEPQTFKIRAILSWEVTPPQNPNYVPVWGNKIDTNIQIKPGLPVSSGEKAPFISAVGNMAVTDIAANGYATGTAVSAGFHAENSPFGGIVSIAGHISNAPNLSAGEANLKYYVSYQKVGTLYWTRINNAFEITISQWNGYDWKQSQLDQIADSEGLYLYREDLKVNPPADSTKQYVEGNILAKWNTNGLSEGLYRVKFTIKQPALPDTDSNIVYVMIDNTSPFASLSINEVINAGALSPAKPCGIFKKGCTIKGLFNATDNHFRSFSFSIEPSVLSPNAIVPTTGAYPSITGASSKEWKLDTTKMQSCGYVIHLHVYDRTIVNSGYISHYNHAQVGFCLTD